MSQNSAFTLHRDAELGSVSIVPHGTKLSADKWTLKQVQGDGVSK